MENLKLTSIRLSKTTLAKANAIGHSFGYYQTSYVLRLAIWLGLKMFKPGVLRKLSHMMWEEEELGACYTLEDVLRAAELMLENHKS